MKKMMDYPWQAIKNNRFYPKLCLYPSMKDEASLDIQSKYLLIISLKT